MKKYRNKKIVTKTSHKLFYGKFIYKLSVNSFYSEHIRKPAFEQVIDAVKLGIEYRPAADIFRKETIDHIQYSCKLHDYLDSIDPKLIYTKDSALYTTLHIYTSKKHIIDNIIAIDPTKVIELYKPADKFLDKLTPSTIAISGFPIFKYKVCFKHHTEPADALYNWCQNNPKVFLSQSAIKQLPIAHGNSSWIYVEDDNTLLMIQLIANALITHVFTIIHI